MKELIKKDYFVPGLLTLIAGILMITSGILSFTADAEWEISLCLGGVIFIISSIITFFNEKEVRKYLIPISYIVMAAIYFIAMGLDIKKGYYNLGFVADLITAILFLGYAILFVLREFEIYDSIWLRALDIVLALVQAACAFFILFSTASFGYRYAKMSVSDSLQIFYILIAYFGYIMLAIGNTLYPDEFVITKK